MLAKHLAVILVVLTTVACTYGYEADGDRVITEGTLGSFEEQKKDAEFYCAVRQKDAVLEGPRYDMFSHAYEWHCK